MKTKITSKLISGLEPGTKAYRVHDTQQPGLFIRVLPSGHMSYMVTWARNKNVTLGRVGKMTLDQARREVARYLAEAHEHGEPLAVSSGRRDATIPTLEAFLDDQFEPWALEHHKDGENGLRALRHSFAELLPLRLDEIDARRIEKLRSCWLESGLAPATANRNLVRLKGVLSRAVDWEVLEVHPLVKVRRLKVDQRGRVRYLTKEEESRLRKALDERQDTMRSERQSANEWRAQRKHELLPDLYALKFTDHLKPLVLLAINTGMRRGETFNLKWGDVDLKNKMVTVEGGGAKSGQTRHLPLNLEAFEALREWKEQQKGEGGYVFPGKGGKRLDNVKKSWVTLLVSAKIDGFRWHDLRHTFASKLVMAGVPLNTVRELLGHSDISMTLRYAHLAPESKAAAVELISFGG
ncbi:tyrosine-type recombinase/integrase [Pseudomonas aeruginosa]|uniref:tyrosine-type recombinase/integrase n=1 Tax=Pseudomonas aeruginosa TaxID=287 RepID=UPI0040542A5B